MVRARAVVITRPGGPEVLALAERELPPPGPGQVLVEVAAAGLNRADVLQRKGLYPAPPGAPPDVPGLESAGVVAACGEGARLWEPGAAVMGIVAGGAMASHLLVHEREVLAAPSTLPLAQAAALPEAFLTAWDALFAQAALAPGETLLVHAAGSGIGTAALQLARDAHATVIGTSRTPGKLARCAALGLHHGLHVEDGRFADAVLALTSGRGVDVVLDTVGGAYLEDDVAVLAEGGRMVTIGLLGGRRGTLDLSRLLSRRAVLRGSTLRARPLEEKIALARGFSRAVLPRFSAGALVPVVDAVLPMQQVADAHRRMEAGETFGKLVLAWNA